MNNQSIAMIKDGKAEIFVFVTREKVFCDGLARPIEGVDLNGKVHSIHESNWICFVRGHDQDKPGYPQKNWFQELCEEWKRNQSAAAI